MINKLKLCVCQIMLSAIGKNNVREGITILCRVIRSPQCEGDT